MDGCENIAPELVDYLDGALNGERTAAVLEHLHGCPVCSRRLEAMRRLMTETAGLSKELPDGLHEAIMERVTREQKGGRWIRFASRRTIAVVAAAALVLVCTASLYGVSQMRKGVTADSATLELWAQNNNQIAGLQEEALERSANSENGELEESVSESPYAYTEEMEEEKGFTEDVAPAECDLEQTQQFDTTAEQTESDLFSGITEDVCYSAVFVMEAEKVPDSLAEYEKSLSAFAITEESRNGPFYMVISTAKIEQLVAECRSEGIEVQQYDAENPVPGKDIVDPSAENALVILQIMP